MAKVIHSVMSISTAHIPLARTRTGHIMAPTMEADFGDVRVLPYNYGWVVFVTDPELGGCSDWLEPIMQVAFEIGSMLIQFDAENEVLSMFTNFEVEAYESSWPTPRLLGGE